MTSMPGPDQIVTVARPRPFCSDTEIICVPVGATIAEIVEAHAEKSGAGLLRSHGVVHIDDQLIPQAIWRCVRPKLGRSVYVNVLPRGGGEGGRAAGKSALAVGVSLAALFAATAVTGGALAPYLGSAFAAGSIGARLAAAGIAIGGVLAASALAPVPVAHQVAGKDTPSGGAGTSVLAAATNQFEPYGIMPRPLGRMRFAPRYAMTPYRVIDNDGVPWVHVLLVWDGGQHGTYHHAIYNDQSTIYDRATLTSAEDVAVEVRDGYTGEAARSQLLTTYYAQQVNSPPVISTTHDGEPGAPAVLAKWHRFTTGPNADVIYIILQFPSGLITIDEDTGGTLQAFKAVRVRMRELGTTTWFNFYQIMFQHQTSSEFWRVIKITRNTGWGTTFASAGAAETIVRPEDISGVTLDPWIPSDKSNQWFHTNLHTAELKATHFVPGKRWEVEVLFSWSGRSNLLTYAVVSGVGFDSYNGHNANLFLGEIWAKRKSLSDNVVISETQSETFVDPIQAENVASVSLRGQRRGFGLIEAEVSTMGEDWDGAEWALAGAAGSVNNIITNPAALLRHALTDPPYGMGYAASQLDLTKIQAFHAYCDSEGHTLGMVIDGDASIAEVEQMIAARGFGVPVYSDKIGVHWERDRSADPPVALLTPRNSWGFRAEKPFPVLPHALRATFRDADDEYAPAEHIVYDDGYNADGSGGLIAASQFQSIQYPGFTTQEFVQARGLFDLRQARLRAMTCTVNQDFEYLIASHGDLVAVSHDVLARTLSYGRITLVEDDGGGNATHITVDDKIFYDTTEAVHNLYVESNLYDVLNLYESSQLIGVAIRLHDSTGAILIKTVIAAATGRLTFVEPFTIPDGLEADCLVAIGPLTTAHRRMIVVDINPASELTAQLTLVDEAPAIWS